MIRIALAAYAIYLTGYVQLYFAFNPICIGGF